MVLLANDPSQTHGQCCRRIVCGMESPASQAPQVTVSLTYFLLSSQTLNYMMIFIINLLII